MSSEQEQSSSLADSGITNFQHTGDPRPLTREEIADGYREPAAPGSETYLAIMRRDGQVGQNIGQHTPSPKVRLLFVTHDGSRAVEKLQRASATDGADHDLEGAYAISLERDPGHGDPVPSESQQRYRELVDDLHGGEL